MERTLYSDRYVTLTFAELDGVVRYTRSALPFPSLDDVRSTHDRVSVVIPWLPGVRLALLLDVREAPPRNDPEFEREITRALDTFLPHFVARAVLVKSAAGVLQARRLEKARGPLQQPVFEDEATAVAHLKRARA